MSAKRSRRLCRPHASSTATPSARSVKALHLRHLHAMGQSPESQELALCKLVSLCQRLASSGWIEGPDFLTFATESKGASMAKMTKTQLIDAIAESSSV